MTTERLIILDHVVALLTAATWLASGAAAAARGSRMSFALLAAAVLATIGRIASVAVLADRGWWFVQEKVLLGLPMLVATALVATALAGPHLARAMRHGDTSAVTVGVVVALFTAGYAAVAGLAATLLAGYPLTVSTALLAVPLVVAAASLTWWVTHPPTVRVGSGAPMVSRRRFIGVAGAAVVAGTGATGFGLAFGSPASIDVGGGRIGTRARTISVADLRGPSTPAAGGAVRRYVLTAGTETVPLSSGRAVEAWTYNGELPGPPVTATQGDLVEVTLRNADIDDGVTLHWHGYDVPCGEDGAPDVTQYALAVGEEFVYRFRADQVGTFWYHTHQVSHRGVRRGLYGALVVTPREQPAERASASLDLTLPVHTFDGTTVIGNNDQLVEHTAAAGVPVRLRLINTDSDPHRLALTGTRFRVAAVDGRDLNQPDEVSHVGLLLAAGGRYDLIFDMPTIPAALIVDNDHDRGVRLHAGDTADPVRVDDTSDWPRLDLLHYGEPAPVPFDVDGTFDRDFTLVLDRGIAMVDGRLAYAHTVNGRGHPTIPQQLVAKGDRVRFTIVNRSLDSHPWHLHGHAVLVLSRDRRPATGSPLWVDTFNVRPGEVWEVAFRATNPGLWMNHCHNLPHASQGMMLQLAYDGVTTPFHHATGKPVRNQRSTHSHQRSGRGSAHGALHHPASFPRAPTSGPDRAPTRHVRIRDAEAH